MLSQDEFHRQVRDALQHLYDYPYLEDHPLALQYWPQVTGPGPRRAHRINRLLLETIEELNPPGTASTDSSRTRYYSLLVYRYVEERSLPDILQAMGYSRSQYFREQQKAIRMLSSALWHKLSAQTPPPSPPGNLLDAEADRVLLEREAVDPAAVVQGVLDVVRHLAEQHGVTLTCDLEPGLPAIYGSRTLLRQVLLKGLSSLISRPGARRIRIRMHREGSRLAAELTARPAPPDPQPGEATTRPEPELEPVRRLVEMMGGRWQGVHVGPGELECRFDFPADSARVLLAIDDNEGIILVFQGYLTGYGYSVVGARSGAQALSLARQLSPTAITLDIMMPSQDGWEILQALKNDPATRRIPVIICSVLEDPQLARSLGAAAYLQKPVSQADLLNALKGLAEPS